MHNQKKSCEMIMASDDQLSDIVRRPDSLSLARQFVAVVVESWRSTGRASKSRSLFYHRDLNNYQYYSEGFLITFIV